MVGQFGLCWCAPSRRSPSGQFLDRLGRRGDTTDDSADILFLAFLQEALVSSCGMGRDVHSLMLSSISSADHSVAHPSRCPGGWSFLHVKASEDLPQACMPDSVKRLLAVYEVVEQIALVL